MRISIGDKRRFGTPSTGFPVARDAKTSRSPSSLTRRRSLFLARRTCFCRAKFARVAKRSARSPPRRICRRGSTARARRRRSLAIGRLALAEILSDYTAASRNKCSAPRGLEKETRHSKCVPTRYANYLKKKIESRGNNRRGGK